MDHLYEILKTGALKRMEAHSFGAPVIVKDPPEDYKQQVHANWMSLILISGTSLRITLRVHFNLYQIKKLLTQTLDIESPKDSQALDFVKEFCNLTAGFVKSTMEEHDMDAGISLPIVTKGFDEIFYTPINSDEKQDLWFMEVGGYPIVCTPSFNIYDQDQVDKLQLAEEGEEDDDDDIDFF